MSGFYNKNEAEMKQTNFDRAIAMLENKKPDFTVDTKEKEDGKFYVFNMEVTEDEFNKFCDQYNDIMKHNINEQDQKLAA